MTFNTSDFFNICLVMLIEILHHEKNTHSPFLHAVSTGRERDCLDGRVGFWRFCPFLEKESINNIGKSCYATSIPHARKVPRMAGNLWAKWFLKSKTACASYFTILLQTSTVRSCVIRHRNTLFVLRNLRVSWHRDAFFLYDNIFHDFLTSWILCLVQIRV
jgi:hypothetical protein